MADATTEGTLTAKSPSLLRGLKGGEGREGERRGREGRRESEHTYVMRRMIGSGGGAVVSRITSHSHLSCKGLHVVGVTQDHQH